MTARIVTIDLGTRAYDIYIGAGLLSSLAEYLPEEVSARRVFIVADENTKIYAQQVFNVLEAAGAQVRDPIIFPAGEATKSFANVESLTAALLSSGVNRDSLILAVGGGVIGDLTGFCASITLRAVPYVQIPTTLLSQVDSSVGGKTGINTAQGKNLVGSFYQPGAVIADLDTLKTLLRRELLAGYAEVVKYGLIRDPGFFEWLEDNGEALCALNEDALSYAIEKSVKAKADVVEEDEHENGRRALLNLGHTFGHALETMAGYDGRLLHGEAVAIGTVMAFDLSVRMGLCAPEEMERVEAHFLKLGLPTRASFISPALKASPAELIEVMKRDKKVKNGKMTFILVSAIGEAFITSDVEESLVHEVLEDSLGETGQSDLELYRQKWKLAFSSHS